MSADSILQEKLRKYYQNSIFGPTSGGLNRLFISSMDEFGSAGFGFSELGNPALGGTMSAGLPENFLVGDMVELYWTTQEPPQDPPVSPGPNDVMVHNYPLTEAIRESRVLSFRARLGDLGLANPLEPLPGFFYYLIRSDENGSILCSNYRPVLIDVVVPGAPAADSTSPINANLAAPMLSALVIDSSTNELRVTISNPQPGPPGGWRNQQVGDRLTLILGNLRFQRPRLVTGDDLGGAYEFVLSRNDFSGLQDGEAVQVQYVIDDLTLNNSRLSPATEVAVRIDPNALVEPEVTDADEPPYELDLRTTQNVEAYIPIAAFDRRSVMTLHFIASTSDGREKEYRESKTYNGRPSDLIFNVPRVYASIAAGGTARLFYEGTVGGVARRSRTRTISIVGAVSTLPAPVIVDAGNTFTLDLSNVVGDQVRVLIPLYAGRQAGDIVTLEMVGNPVGGSTRITYFREAVPPGGDAVEVLVRISVAELRLLLNGTLSLSYEVLTTFADGSTLTRRSIDDPVYNVVDHSVMYPAPTCAQLVDSATGKFLPVDTPRAVIVVTEASIRALNLPLPNDGENITFTLRARTGNTPAPHIWPARYSQGVGLSSTLDNANFRPFDQTDVQITYDVPVERPTM